MMEPTFEGASIGLPLVIGIDTSNYTTSLAILDIEGKLLANLKRPLPVAQGERGLRQSDAVFSHVKNFPSLTEEAQEYIKGRRIAAVGVSTRPRLQEGSYMPCFLTGQAFASSIALAAKAPLYTFSHQCGHVMAALYSADCLSWTKAPFCAFHVSGGTTEVLRVCEAPDFGGFKAELVGGTKDLNAGQIIDRIGVYMGLSFPCGIEMEKLALSFKGRIPRRKMKVENGYANLSGLENIACKMYDESKDSALCSAFVFSVLAETLEALCLQFFEKYGEMPVVFAGGVMSNTLIRSKLEKRFRAAFAAPELSRDNALGIAELARRKWNQK